VPYYSLRKVGRRVSPYSLLSAIAAKKNCCAIWNESFLQNLAHCHHTAGHVVMPYSWSRGYAIQLSLLNHAADHVVKPYSWSRGYAIQLVTWLYHTAGHVVMPLQLVTWLNHTAGHVVVSCSCRG